jgi:tetratricopeptide (TPR) repeat protein
VDTPVNELPAEQVFDNEVLADAAVADIYYVLAGYYTSSVSSVINGMTADELSTLIPSNIKYVNNAIPSEDLLMLLIWRDFYKAVYRANAVLEGLASSGIAADKAAQLTGEAYFLRAFCYYYLVNNWGDVPLITATDVTKTALAPRTPTTDVYAQIISDLQRAVTLLPVAYSSNEKVRANKWAAIAMLARVFLQQGNWKEAAANASLVINSGRFFPLSQPDSLFLKNSRSAILQFWIKDGFTFSGQTFIPINASNYSFYPLTKNLLNAFEPGDVRKTKWTGTFTYAGELYYYPYKYKQRTITTGDTAEYVMVLRIAEQYLIRAEALCQQGNITAAVADLNIIRHRAGLPDLPVDMNKASCLLAIEQERRVEFFSEWGDRWLTLKRSGRINTVLAALKSTWDPTAVLYPIPEQERSRNPHLTQNDGYQ